MNEETITFRLDQIEKKLDTLTDILLQTQAQEIRLTTVENGKVVYNSLKHSNCVQKGKPTKARIITLA